MIRMLLESESDLVRAEDGQKRTPLHIACSMGNVQAVQELLKHIQGEYVCILALLNLCFVWIWPLCTWLSTSRHHMMSASLQAEVTAKLNPVCVCVWGGVNG